MSKAVVNISDMIEISIEPGFLDNGVEKIYPQELIKTLNISPEKASFYRAFFKKFYSKYPTLKGKIITRKKELIGLNKLEDRQLLANNFFLIFKDLFFIKLIKDGNNLRKKVNSKKKDKIENLVWKLSEKTFPFFTQYEICNTNNILEVAEKMEYLEEVYVPYYNDLQDKKLVNFRNLNNELINKKLSSLEFGNLDELLTLIPFVSYLEKFIQLLSKLLKKTKENIYSEMLNGKIDLFDFLDVAHNENIELDLLVDLAYYFVNSLTVFNYFHNTLKSINENGQVYFKPFSEKEKYLINLLESILAFKDIDKFSSLFKSFDFIFSLEDTLPKELLYQLISMKETDIQKIRTLANLGIFSKSSVINNHNFLKFVLSNFNFFAKYPNIIEHIEIGQIEYLEMIKSKLSKDEFAFLIENKLYGFPIEVIKLLYQFSLKKYDISLLKAYDLETLKVIFQNNLSLEEVRQVREISLDNILKQKQLKEFRTYYKSAIYFFTKTNFLSSQANKFLAELDNLIIDSFDKKKAKLQKFWDNNFKVHFDRVNYLQEKYKITLDKLISYFNIFETKATKKNKLNTKVIFNILDYLLANFDKQELDYLFKILKNPNIYISSSFLSNYEVILKKIMYNKFFIKTSINSPTSLTDLFELIKEEDIKKIVSSKFSSDLSYFILEKKTSELFYKILTIEDILQNGNDEDFYLDLLSLEEDKFKRYYFLIKNFNIIGINVESRYDEILNLVKNDYFTEEKLKDLKKLIKTNSIPEPEIFYYLFLEYVSNKDSDISVFDILFEEPERIESDEEFEKNTGIRGLAGWSGKEIVKKFEKLGWKKKKVNGKLQGKGDHILMFKEENGKKRYTLIPLHNPVKAKTLFDTLNRAKIRKEDFLNA